MGPTGVDLSRMMMDTISIDIVVCACVPGGEGPSDSISCQMMRTPDWVDAGHTYGTLWLTAGHVAALVEDIDGLEKWIDELDAQVDQSKALVPPLTGALLPCLP